MPSSIELIIGIVCAFVGGELFLKGVVGISAWLRIPKAVTATTLAAFATSSPEISVAITSALNNTPQIALGDALGSNIVNVALVLGLVLCIGPMRFEWKPNRREFCCALLCPLLVLGMIFDGKFERWEALFCIAIFILWLGYVVRDAMHERRKTPPSASRREGLISLVYGACGLGFLILAGKMIVSGASGLGKDAGLDPFIIGATMVAFGTSAPELATAVMSKLRGHDEVGIGTILGSNLFNCLFIVGIAGGIQPYSEPLMHVLPSLLFGMLAVAILTPVGSTTLKRPRGIVLLILYVASVVVTILLQTPHGG